MALQVIMTVTRPNAETAEMGLSEAFNSAMNTAIAAGDVTTTSEETDGLVTRYTAVFVNEAARDNFTDLAAVTEYHDALDAYNAEHGIEVEFTESEV